MTWEMTDDETKAMTQSKPHALNKGRKDGRKEGRKEGRGRESNRAEEGGGKYDTVPSSIL